MSDATGPVDDGYAVTQGGGPPTQAVSLEVTQGGGPPTQADSLEGTEVDPYATVLPPDPAGDATAVGTLEKTEVDPYATRYSEIPGTHPGLAETQATGGTGGSGGGGASPTRLERSRYRAVRLHARGGLGEIYVAVDSELNREVALKEIQEHHGGRAESQFRFLFEAEVTGGLEHPGIVPVYGLGQYPDGRPYYAMRFIRGDSLKSAIKKFHEKTAGQPRNLGHSLEFRQLIGRFIAVCHAIDYAHSRGVLHRDIKPDNIMLGPHGETLVVDWGLAKVIDLPDLPTSTGPKLLRPLAGTDISATVHGSVMGTPSYMSPEQAAGEVDGLGPASDIFSLGSTLYVMMVGKAPFHGMSIVELLDHVRQARFPAPRTLDRAIPPALEAICLKAMALSPEDRYATAGALATDLDRWLADEPVQAYPEPLITRLGRWVRRHRTAVAASFALLLTVSTALSISNVLIGRERTKAERNFQRARSAVEQMLTRVGEVELADIPQMEAVRRQLLERALAFYREFLEERGGDPTSRRETGRALGRLGDIHEMLGQYVQAEDEYRQAMKLLDGLATSPGANRESRRAMARTRANLGILLKKSNRFVESEAFLRSGLRDFRDLAAESPQEPEDARGLTTTRYQLGTLLARLNNRDAEDEATYRAAIAEQETLASRKSDQAEALRELARYLNNLGILLAAADPDAAEATFLRAMKIQDELESASASNAGFRWQRARTWNNLAILYSKAGLADEAEPAFLRAKAGFEALAADFPKVPEYRRELAVELNNLGVLLRNRQPGRWTPAELFRIALEDQRRLIDEFPEVPDHRLKLGVTYLNLGDLLRATEPAQAEEFFGKAIRLHEKLVADYPEVPEYHAALGRILNAQAVLLGGYGEGRRSEALDLLARAIRSLKQARRGNDRDRSFTRYLVDAHKDRAEILAQAGRHADLAAEADQVAKVAPERSEGFIVAAGLLARSVELASRDPDLTGSKLREVEDAYTHSAVTMLQTGSDRGHKDVTILDGATFRSLKGRPEFETLREAWKAKGKQGVG